MADIIDAPMVKREDAPLATQGGGDIMRLLQSAIDKGVDVATLERLEAMYERAIKRTAEAAFDEAFARFKAECPPIVRRTQDEYITVTRDGVRKPRMYACIGDIAAVVDPVLSRHGLAYTWADSELTADGCIVRKFILRHRDGGEPRLTASPPIPIEGGDAYKKISDGRKATSASPQQRMGVADTYAMRYSMISGLGLTTCDEDDDGHGGGAADEPITEDQARTVNDLLIESGADKAKFLAWALPNVARDDRKIADIPAKMFETACKLLNDKIREKAKGKA